MRRVCLCFWSGRHESGRRNVHRATCSRCCGTTLGIPSAGRRRFRNCSLCPVGERSFSPYFVHLSRWDFLFSWHEQQTKTLGKITVTRGWQVLCSLMIRLNLRAFSGWIIVIVWLVPIEMLTVHGSYWRCCGTVMSSRPTWSVWGDSLHSIY